MERGWTLTGVGVLLGSLLVAGCSGEGDRIEVTTPSGRMLDCPSEEVAYLASGGPDLADAVGAGSAQGARESLHDLDRPPGHPVVEEASPAEVVFVFLDDAGHRLGRVGTRLYDQRGWFFFLMEKCGGAGSNRPSQTPAEAQRDGVVPALAEFPLSQRVERRVEVSAEEGTWVLATPTEAVYRAAAAEGGRLGDPAASDPEQVIGVSEYGEVLLIDEVGTILRAYPMPTVPPHWILVTSAAIYAGHIGDGAMPDSSLVRIDRRTLQAQVLAIQSSLESWERHWPVGWRVATAEQARLYAEVVGYGPEATGVEAASCKGRVAVDPDGIDRLFAESEP